MQTNLIKEIWTAQNDNEYKEDGTNLLLNLHLQNLERKVYVEGQQMRHHIIFIVYRRINIGVSVSKCARNLVGLKQLKQDSKLYSN